MTQLVIPSRLDALYVRERTQVIGPISDYEILPWFDGKRDHNSLTPNLGWAINAKPFADHRTQLEPGVHLHWALPDALTRGGTRQTVTRSVQVDDLWFQPAPNRWLVLRRAEDQQGHDKAWLIESDYVHAHDDPPEMPCTVYPRFHDVEGAPPYLLLGRQIALEPKTLKPVVAAAPMEAGNRLTSYAPALTAIGPADPYFSAHYTSCRSVFGMVDADVEDASQKLVYNVFGWYADAAADPLGRLVEDLDAYPEKAWQILALKDAEAKKVPAVKTGGALPDKKRTDALRHAVKREFGSGMFHSNDWDFPTAIICHGQTRLDRSIDTSLAQPEGAKPIGFGSTAAEAFAASLNVPEDVEDRVVQSLASTDLSNHPLDLGQKLREARHNEQFRGFEGHAIWVIRPEEATKQDGHQGALTLDDDLAHELNLLNVAQEDYNAARDRINAMRQALFADWTHFMRAAYPEGDQDPFAVNPNALSEHIDRTRLGPLEEMLDHAGELFVSEQETGNLHLSDDLFRGFGTQAPYGEVAGTATGTVRRTGDANGLRPVEIFIRSGNVLDGIELRGPLGPATAIGGRGGSPVGIMLAPGEYLSEISGIAGDFMNYKSMSKLVLRTNFGRSFGPFGTEGKGKMQPFRLAAPAGTAITGLAGTIDAWVSSLQLLVTPLRGHTAHAVPPRGTLAERVKVHHGIVKAKLAQGDNARAGLSLGLTPGPRYWRAHDPVIVLSDAVARPSSRHMKLADHPNATARSFQTMHAKNWDWRTKEIAGQGKRITSDSGLMGLTGGPVPWGTDSSGENWHPLHLEWQAELQPRGYAGNTGDGVFEQNFITRTHDLPDDYADLTPRGRPQLSRTYEYLSGRATLNTSVGALMLSRLGDMPKDLRSRLDTTDTAPTILPLGGLHEQLIMRQVEHQLPIADPIGVPMQKDLARRVNDAMGAYHPRTPLPQAPFHPIRSGDLLFQRLRLVDTFGRTKEWQPDRVRTTRRMTSMSKRRDRVRLPVRLCQPARLNFRWLSASHPGDIESNAHPATTPICGWLLSNDLGGEIDVYDWTGELLGTVNHRAEWSQAPAAPGAPRLVEDIRNAELRRVVAWMCHGGDHDRIGRFIHVLDESLAAIDPKDAQRHQARAMLIGRPIAVVRARLSLRVMGGLAEEQSLEALKHRMDGSVSRATHDYEHVHVPVRLGEHGQLNDGLCGYWIEDKGRFRGDMFHTPHGVKAEESHHHIRVLSNDDLVDYPLKVTLDSDPVIVTMLVDPRGSVHATTGILPVKSIAIPEDQYHNQISNLKAVFSCGPLMMPPDEIALPLPTEPGFSWSWLHQDGDEWGEVPHHPAVTRDQLIDGFGLIGPELWDRLREIGRIQPGLRAGQGMLMPGNPDAPEDRFEDLGLTVEAVERGLHALAQSIEPTHTEARYDGRSIAHNGWLQLQPNPLQARHNNAEDG